MAVRLISRIRQLLGSDVAIRDLFASPVLADLARKVERSERTQLPAIARAERGERLPLSFAQQRLWFLAEMEGASDAYHIPFGYLLRGELDRKALRRTLDRIVVRHEVLRTSFVQIDGVPVQQIAAAENSRFDL